MKKEKLRSHRYWNPKERKACSFERIYFSRGSDEKIYRERKGPGIQLSEQVLHAIDHDLKNTIFSFIPNTAETAFLWYAERDGKLPE
jgi:amidophosphoribosyltransferase